MKFFSVIILAILMLAFFMPPSLYAQDVVPAGPALVIPGSSGELKELANQFYRRCHENPDNTLNAEQQEEYCVCLSAQMYRKQLKPSERIYLATGQGEKMSYERSIAEVYGQCIGIPGRVATYQKCATSPKAYMWTKGEKELDAMCSCVVNELDYYWSSIAPAYLEVETIYRRGINDPLKYVMENRDFPIMYSKKRSKCTSIYGRRD